MNRLVYAQQAVQPVNWEQVMNGWRTAWLVFAGYVLCIFVLFYLFFPKRKSTGS